MGEQRGEEQQLKDVENADSGSAVVQLQILRVVQHMAEEKMQQSHWEKECKILRMQERLISLWQISSVEHKDTAACFIIGWEKEKCSTFQVQGKEKTEN